jgi:hypothetical protein
MKTYRDWEDNHTSLELGQYLQPLDEVDEEMRNHCAEIVAPQYCNSELIQMGEADYEKDGVNYYTTFITINQRHYYLGPLPEFHQ